MYDSMEELRTKLINEILFAASQDEVKQLVGGAINTIERNERGNHLMEGFAEGTCKILSSFDPMNKNAQQWSNIQLARILFNRLRKRVSEPVK